MSPVVAHMHGKTARLLIADDDPGFRQTVVDILRPRFETIAVESGERAIEVVETTTIDLVLFDMHMHLLTGLEAIRWVKRHRAELPCILMTADLTSELQEQARQLETFSVLRKPPPRDELLNTIQRALEL